jgi:hypothetical protein
VVLLNQKGKLMRQEKMESLGEGLKKTKKYESQTREYKQAKRLQSRIKMLRYLGGECINCGFSDWRALQVDHINANRGKDKITYGESYHKKVMKSYDNDENKYQILCANCNWIKRYENGETRKEKNNKALY